jgi:ribonuclease M5
MKRRIEGIVVVEGKSDTQRLQQYYEVETFETSGMGINDEILDTLEELSQKHKIIVFTDPDMPGEYIRRKVVERIPNALHVIINKQHAISKNKRKVGVEHAEKQYLDEAFAKIHQLLPAEQQAFTQYNQNDMVYYGFVGLADSKKRRDFVAQTLHLGRINAKQFLKRLNLFMIAKPEIEKVLQNYLEQYGEE